MNSKFFKAGAIIASSREANLFLAQVIKNTVEELTKLKKKKKKNKISIIKGVKGKRSI